MKVAIRKLSKNGAMYVVSSEIFLDVNQSFVDDFIRIKNMKETAYGSFFKQTAWDKAEEIAIIN